MRLEYSFELAKVEVPRFSVEAVEGIGKLFTLATLVLNVLASKAVVEIVFHGLNPEDPESKIEAFREIISGSEDGLIELLPLAQDPGLTPPPARSTSRATEH